MVKSKKTAIAGLLLLLYLLVMIAWLRDVGTRLLSPHEDILILAESNNHPWQEVAPSIDVDIPGWLQQYVAFHKKAIANAKKGIDKDTNSYLINFCKNKMRCSGTANQQRAIAAALMVSILTRRVFLIDIDRPVRLDQILSPNLLEWNYKLNMTLSDQPLRNSQFQMKTEIMNARNIHPPILDSPSRFMPNKSSQVIFIVTNVPASLHSLWKTKETRSFLENYNMSNRIFPKQIYKWLFFSLFQPSTLLSAHMTNVRNQLSISRSSSYVGVHIRTGDEEFHEKQHKRHGHGHQREDLEEFVTCANNIKKHYFGKDIPIVLVTDNPGTRLLVSSMDPFVRYANTSIIHSDLSDPSVNNLEGNLNVWSDIFLLAGANYTVTSRGSFSELGRRLSAPLFSSVKVSSCSNFFVNMSN